MKYTKLALVAIGVFALVVLSLTMAAPAAARPPAQATVAPTTAATAAPTTAATAAPTGAATAGGKIALLLPETKTTRYEAADRPLFEAKFKALCPSCTIIYSNANQDPTLQANQVDAALTNGAKVLVLDPVDSDAAGALADKAKAAGVPVIAYDRLINNSDAVSYYISFDNTKVGMLQAQALVDALTALGKTNPTIVMINGSPTDNNAGMFKAGAHSVFDPLVKAGKLTIAKEYDTPDWSPDQAQNEMQQALTALGNKVDGVYAANDGTGGGAIAAMKTAGLSPLPPVTGQDAELAAIQRIIAGQQYMTVYKPFKPEAEAAATLANYLLAKTTVPSDMVTGKTNNKKVDVPSVLLTPVSVTASNVGSSVVADAFYTIDQLCTSQYADACKSAGLNSAGGKIALLLPETKTTRYEAADKPLFEGQFKVLCPTCTDIYSNANQDPTLQANQVDAALTNGAKVLVLDPVDSDAAGALADKAKAAGVPVIAYDRLINNSDAVSYYISFDNTKVGMLQAQALVDALTALGKTNPTIVMINGSPTDNNAGMFKAGAHSVFDPLVKAGKLTIAKEYDTPDWSPDQAQNEMQQALTALGNKVDGVYAANDGTGGGAIAAMKTAGLSPLPPVTGQDAELAAIQRIIAGQQYMTVYKPFKPEAQTAATLASIALLKATPPAGMVTGKTNNKKIDVPSVLLTPVSVTKDNVKTTVIADGFYTVQQICTAQYADACKAAGLQ